MRWVRMVPLSSTVTLKVVSVTPVFSVFTDTGRPSPDTIGPDADAPGASASAPAAAAAIATIPLRRAPIQM